MFEKAGKYYADWRDRTGARKRKAFKSERAALLHESQQKELAHPKKKALGAQLRTFSAPSTSRSQAAKPRTKLVNSSSGLQVVSRRAPSQQPMSPKLTKALNAATTHTPRGATNRPR
jgi:hypothetical protein